MSEECYLVDKKTCCFGIVMQDGRCDVRHTYASFHRREYDVYIVVCGGLGIAAFLACVHKFYCISKAGGSPIQKQVYALLIVASLTFIARAIDPMSHDFIYPPLVSGLITDVCTASLYSVLILSVAFWARIVLSPTDLVAFEYPIQAFMGLGLFLTWFVFVCIRPMYLLVGASNTPERIFHSWHILIQYSMAPFLLLLISTLAIYFGVRIHRRLKAIRDANERAMAISTMRQAALDAKNQVVRSESQDELPPRPTSHVDDYLEAPKGNTRIIKVLILMEILSLWVVGAQIYVLVEFIKHGCMLEKEYQCSSRGASRCQMSFPFPVLPLSQFLGIIVMYWSFRKTRPLTREAVTAEMFSNRSMIVVMEMGEQSTGHVDSEIKPM